MGGAPLVALFLALAAAAAGRAVSAAGARPSEVAVGALFTYDSTIGRAAGLAIELAVDDVNADGTVLAGTKLSLKTRDTNCSGFIGTIEGWGFLSAYYFLSSSVIHVHAPKIRITVSRFRIIASRIRICGAEVSSVEASLNKVMHSCRAFHNC
jgi:ionotropic glutamate receptor